MITDSSVEIGAPAAIVWDVFADVERWPTWTRSVERIVALDGPGIEVGKRFEIKQPRLPNLVWEVTEVEPGVSWTWRQRSFGGTTFATHEVVPQEGERTLVRQRIDQRGPIGVAVGVLMLRLTKRYLDLEAQGLKAHSEQRRREDASPG
ncbi:MAG TPA: SRPBCC family protein [Ilumatobacteraceae bacterium]|nr:SRPBCC family protein [Ilumatobacteraceae bacterium]